MNLVKLWIVVWKTQEVNDPICGAYPLGKWVDVRSLISENIGQHVDTRRNVSLENYDHCY